MKETHGIARRGALGAIGLLGTGAVLGPARAASSFPDRPSLEMAVEQLRLAMLAGNAEALNTLLHDRLDYMHSSGRSQTKRDVIGQLGGSRFFAELEFSEASFEIAGCAGIVKLTVDQTKNLADGKTRKSRIVTLLTWVASDSAWQLIARASAIIESPLFPPCNPTGPSGQAGRTQD